MGSMLRFVPHSVMTGFINGIGILIILGQLGNLTGYDTQGANKITQTFDLLRNLDQVDLRTLLVGIITILLIITLEKTRLKSFGIVVALLVASLLVPALGWDSVATVADIADIPDSLPRPMLPEWSILPSLILPALSLALVGLVQGAGVSQNYVNPNGKYPDPSGDFTGQGVANIAAGLFQGMPVGGSLSATALVHSSGAKSRFANIFAGITIAIALLLFSRGISAIAMPALAGLLIVVGFGTISVDDIRMVWKTGSMQQIVMLITFAFTLLIPLQYAVLIGVALAIILFVVSQSNKITLKEWIIKDGQLPLEKDPPEVLEPHKATILVPFGSLFFAAVESFEEMLPGVEEDSHNAVVIFNLRNRKELGSTFLESLQRYAGELQDHKSKLMLAEVSPFAKRVLEDTQQIQTYGRDNIFLATEFYGEATKSAIHEAEKWIASNQGAEL
jgi:SulP family sulfate permease